MWAKREPRGRKAKTRVYHALIYHLLDVAAVAYGMWDDVLGAGQKKWLMEMLGLDDETAARGMMALLAGLHDIGKATPAFQQKAPDLYDELKEAGLHERIPPGAPPAHGILSAVILCRWLRGKGIDKQQASQLAAVIGGHHGSWISNTEASGKSAGEEKWQDLQNELCDTLQEVLGVAEINPPKETQAFNVFAAFLSGFVSVCDWMGSNKDDFPYEDKDVSPQNYFQCAREQAKKALSDWSDWKADGRRPAFDDVFPFAPNALQQEGIQHLQGFEQAPRLILVEYPTGEGKTELALHIGDLLVNGFGLAGTYIAMPTQATSNQMFERVEDYLRERYRDIDLKLQLIHGGAAQYKSSHQHTLSESDQEGNDSADDAVSWFEQNRKRALLTPYAVGTIDQAMLSVLQVKHHFVRQFGLSRKVIIFDEIHSYDTYMDEIIKRLFNWLHALDSPMILLSATLSRQGRQEILKAVGASNAEGMPDKPYPRLTVVEHDGEARVHCLPPPDTREIQIRRMALDLDSLLDAVRPVYEKGGCIAIVCNTVSESIEAARALREAEGIDENEVWLLHARFPPAYREEKQEQAIGAFKKDGTRPERAILVATQIIEQSLDLDFDLMVSRTAPIDLLIQRMGRLHRHPRPSRPSHLARPTLLLRTPDMKTDDVPDFGVDGLIYERFFLLKTWLCLRDVEQMRIPDGVDELMNAVYNQEIDIENISSAYREALAAAWGDMELGNRNSEFRGAQFVIREPSSKRLIGRYSARLSDDERSIKTRNIRPGLDIICIMDEDLLALTQRKPSKDEVDNLLRYKVTVRRKDVKQALEQLEANPHWAKKPQLKYARGVIFDGDRFAIPNTAYSLRLTLGYGLEIINQEEA